MVRTPHFGLARSAVSLGATAASAAARPTTVGGRRIAQTPCVSPPSTSRATPVM
jgi:hypothetical protein